MVLLGKSFEQRRTKTETYSPYIINKQIHLFLMPRQNQKITIPFGLKVTQQSANFIHNENFRFYKAISKTIC